MTAQNQQSRTQWSFGPDSYSLCRGVGGRSGRDTLSAVWDVHVTESALDSTTTTSATAQAEVLFVLQEASACVYVRVGVSAHLWQWSTALT